MAGGTEIVECCYEGCSSPANVFIASDGSKLCESHAVVVLTTWMGGAGAAAVFERATTQALWGERFMRAVAHLLAELLDEQVAAGELVRIVRSVRQSVVEGDTLHSNSRIAALALDLARELGDEVVCGCDVGDCAVHLGSGLPVTEGESNG